ncbi:hypothetical protein B5X24_HaOG204030 [Helicoverpa armigera]|uniref:Uncharacterized protein n=1 Tax=Helicoverpa armigera TaxID=29058 RepID=A0A2W1BRF0_HELAM|nr:hypothetical protein B5X24_HaOG204030 [Helicoverpa armigera]
MAPTETKLVLSRIVVSAAVFISLCVELPSVRAAEVRRCYWCGPLAEQVHRSTRALPCSGPHTQVTVCDPGFPYCAVVATSPPYIESRYCVKLYQDECYSLYCNSTRTWRMTCPCRGDLCNGPNTDREEDAFAGLAKLVARTHNTRVRRALISTSGFINMNTKTNRIDNTTVEDNKMIPFNTSDNVVDTDLTNDNQMNETNTNEDGGNKEEESSADETATVVPDVKNDENEMPETATVANVELNNEAPTSSANNDADEVIKTTDAQMNETSIQIDIPTVEIESSDLKTEIILMSSETTKVVKDMEPSDVTNANENIPEIHTVPEITTQATVELKDTAGMTTQATITSPTEEKVTISKVKPSEQLPTAEALQHNDTPSTKATEQVTMSTATTSMQPMQVLTTEATKPRNNTAVRMETHILTLAVGVILHFKI